MLGYGRANDVSDPGHRPSSRFSACRSPVS
jgi:hypothetical protein